MPHAGKSHGGSRLKAKDYKKPGWSIKKKGKRTPKKRKKTK